MRSLETMLRSGVLLGGLAMIGSAGCAHERDEPARAPAPGYPPPGQYVPPQGYPPQGQPQQPANPMSGLGGMLGAALTPFGILLQQLPQLPAQLPPLPDLSKGWPFPWPFPPPAPSGPNPAPPSWPQPGAGDWVAIEDEVLRLTNQRRAMGAVCGGCAACPTPAAQAGRARAQPGYGRPRVFRSSNARGQGARAARAIGRLSQHLRGREHCGRIHQSAGGGAGLDGQPWALPQRD